MYILFTKTQKQVAAVSLVITNKWKQLYNYDNPQSGHQKVMLYSKSRDLNNIQNVSDIYIKLIYNVQTALILYYAVPACSCYKS